MSLINEIRTQYCSEERRLQSFVNNPNWYCTSGIPIRQYVEAGMFYSGAGDTTRCAWCGFSLKNWTFYDDPKQEHKNLKKDCPVNDIHLSNRPPIKYIYHDSTNSVIYQLTEERLKTFIDTPYTGTPYHCIDDFVDAGFYWMGHATSMKCAWCGIAIKEWSKDIPVWEKHKLMAPDCHYIKNHLFAQIKVKKTGSIKPECNCLSGIDHPC